ncbi:MAG TPA: hypothetical protein VFY13_05545, partial [Luteolibacter sp.]|nr:hypothetical protein [Luteolibacter sp.]
MPGIRERTSVWSTGACILALGGLLLSGSCSDSTSSQSPGEAGTATIKGGPLNGQKVRISFTEFKPAIQLRGS